MLCGWEGNRRSGVPPAMHHRLRGLSTYGLNGHCVGDEHLAYALGARHLYLTKHAYCYADVNWLWGRYDHINSCKRRRFIGHILQLPSTALAIAWLYSGHHKMAGGRLEDQRRHDKTQWKIWRHWVWTGGTRELLPAIVPSGNISGV